MERRQVTKKLAGIAGSALPPHVSIKGQRFTLIDGSGQTYLWPTMDLDVIILDINENMSRIYWGRPYEGDESEGPPLCFSDNGISPSTRAQAPQATLCKPHSEYEPNGCRWSVWGSAVSKLSGEGIPACQNGLKLAVIPVAVRDKEWFPALPNNPSMIFFLRVPPASLGLAATYGKKVAGLGKITIPWTGEETSPELSHVITRINFVQGATGKLDFRTVGYINEELDNLIEGIPQEKIDVTIGRTDLAISALPPPDQRVIQSAPAQPAGEAPEPKRPRGRPRKSDAPVTTSENTPHEVLMGRAAGSFEPRPNPNIVTTEDVQRDVAAQQAQEGREAMADQQKERDAREEQKAIANQIQQQKERDAMAHRQAMVDANKRSEEKLPKLEFGMQEKAPPPPPAGAASAPSRPPSPLHPDATAPSNPLDRFMNISFDS